MAMQFTYTLHYREQLEATQARFAGDPPRPTPRPTAVAMLAVLTLSAGIYVLLSRMPAASRAAVPAPVNDGSAAATPDPMEHPVFGPGAIVAALGGALYVVPLAYVLGMRRSARPVHDGPVTVRLDEDAVTVRSATKDFSLRWDGVVAVAETPRLFVLKTVSDLRLSLPKRVVDEPADVDALRGVLQERIPAMAGVAES
jgi:hypothetical protein